MKALHSTMAVAHAALVSLALVSCSSGMAFLPGSGVDLRVTLPQVPASWASLGPTRFKVEWRDSSGLRRSRLAGPGEVLDLRVARGVPQSVLAYPYVGSDLGEAGFRPAGLRYPLALSLPASMLPDGSLALDWRGGWLASACRAIERTGALPEAFDLQRLWRELGARSADPWFLDPAEAASCLLEGRFRASLLDEPLLFNVELPLPGPWFSRSSLAPATADPVGAGGSAFQALLPAGTSVLVGASGLLVVSVDAEGGALWVRWPGPPVLR